MNEGIASMIAEAKRRVALGKPAPAPVRQSVGGLAYIRRAYLVEAHRGGKIIYAASDGEPIPAIIVGARDGKLRARLENADGTLQRRTVLLHPTWHITYLPNSQLNKPGLHNNP